MIIHIPPIAKLRLLVHLLTTSTIQTVHLFIPLLINPWIELIRLHHKMMYSGEMGQLKATHQ